MKQIIKMAVLDLALKFQLMEKNCSKCGEKFTCRNESRGCWCEQLQVSDETLIQLKENFENCLCPACLASYSVNDAEMTKR